MATDFHSKGAAIKRLIESDLRETAISLLSGLTATLAAQKDGVGISDQHRVLNFQGAGVTVSDDPTMRRTNILIAGSALVSAPSQLVISTASAKTLSLWNGASNNAPPANWQTTGFNDAAWANALAVTGGGSATTIGGAARLWPTQTPAGMTEQALFRHSFTVTAGTYQSISVTIEGDNFVDAVYLNGTLLGSAVNGSPGVANSKTTLSITPSLLIVGTNVLAVLGRNADPTAVTLNSGWSAYVINSTVVTAAPTTSNTASAALSGDVTIAVVNTFYDGPAVSLGIGTWLVSGHVTLQDNTAGGNFTAKLWDGPTVICSAENSSNAATAVTHITLSGLVTLAATTTIKISVTNSVHAGASFIKAATPQNSQGNNASYIMAVQIA